MRNKQLLAVVRQLTEDRANELHTKSKEENKEEKALIESAIKELEVITIYFHLPRQSTLASYVCVYMYMATLHSYIAFYDKNFSVFWNITINRFTCLRLYFCDLQTGQCQVICFVSF